MGILFSNSSCNFGKPSCRKVSSVLRKHNPPRAVMCNGNRGRGGRARLRRTHRFCPRSGGGCRLTKVRDKTGENGSRACTSKEQSARSVPSEPSGTNADLLLLTPGHPRCPRGGKLHEACTGRTPVSDSGTPRESVIISKPMILFLQHVVCHRGNQPSVLVGT